MTFPDGVNFRQHFAVGVEVPATSGEVKLDVFVGLQVGRNVTVESRTWSVGDRNGPGNSRSASMRPTRHSASNGPEVH